MFYICLRVWSETFQQDAPVSPGRTLYRYILVLRVVSDLEVQEVETLYHDVHVPLLSLTCGTSRTCRVWHSFVIRVETLAFIKNKK